MNREQMIETIARVRLRVYDEEFDATHLSWQDFQGEARTIVDAILPQVTTVEELEALPARTALTDRDGRVWRHPGPWILPWFRNDHDVYDHRTSDVLRGGPLTVVWQP